VCDSIEQLVPNHRLLMRFWQEKNAENPGKSSLLRFDDSRDSYDRCDYYNTYGLAVFYMLKLRRAQFAHMGLDLGVWEGFELTSDKGLEFMLPHGPEYTFEVFQPLLLVTAQSKSETVKALTFETLQMLIYFNQANLERISGLTKFSGDDKTVKDIFVQAFVSLGEHTPYAKELNASEVKMIQNSRVRTVS